MAAPEAQSLSLTDLPDMPPEGFEAAIPDWKDQFIREITLCVLQQVCPVIGVTIPAHLTGNEKPVTDSTPLGKICVNVPIIPYDTHFATLGSYLDAAHERLAPVITVKRAHSAGRPCGEVLLARTLVFLHRPNQFITERWDTPRYVLSNTAQLRDFMARYRPVILDFFNALIRNKILGSKPKPLTEEEFLSPKRRRVMLTNWRDRLLY